MPALSTGEQPTYLDIYIDTWQRPRHDHPEINPETGLPTESGWIHRPYAGRGRRGRTWVRAGQPQPEQGGDEAGRAAAAAAAAADEPMAPPTAPAALDTPARQMSGEAEAEAETEQRLLQGLDAEADPGVFNHPAFPFLGTDHTLPRPVFGPTLVPEPFQGPWTPIPEPVPEARPSTASSSSGQDQRRRAAPPVTEPAFEPVPGSRRSAEHDPADEAVRQAAALRRRLLDDLPQQLRAGLRRAQDLLPSERPQAEALARLTEQPEAPGPELPRERRQTTSIAALQPEVLLVGTARGKEIIFDTLTPPKKAAFHEAMAKEWSRWRQFKATIHVSADMLQELPADLQIVGTRWVLTGKANGTAKARLVVQ